MDSVRIHANHNSKIARVGWRAGIAANSPVGVRNAKRAMRGGADVSLAAGLDIEDSAWRATVFSDDRREGVAAFNEKRPPAWPHP